ncbi:MAG TPA: hypothetical protein VNX67_06215 [Solirubrobacteraceae bacterium]|nr:hypothetical protein [Solirubrobacteraceae bacterium]
MSRRRAALLAGLLAGSLLTATVAVQDATATVIGRSPFGLSMEYPLMEKALGGQPCPSPALVATLKSLGSPTIRIGGDSQDLAGPTGTYHYAVAPSFWPALGCLARESGVPVVVGLNFAEGPLADDLSTIAAAEQAIPAAQLSFSLGNEPDLYGFSHILPGEPGFTVPAYRQPPWTAAAFAGEWMSRRTELGDVPVEGPDLAGIGWRVPMAKTLEGDPPVAMTAHAYPTAACGSAAAPTTAARLLSEHASVGLVEKYAWLLTVAKAAHRPAVISESNSASCGGRPGVSDKPVAGVWAARYVVAAMLDGWAQVRFHTAGTSYDALSFEANGTVAVHPLGHALLFLHRWIPVGSRVTSDSTGAQVIAAKITADGHVSVIVSSFSPKPMPFTVAVPGAATHLHTDTISTASAIEAGASLAVHSHRARLVMAPNTVVAVQVS